MKSSRFIALAFAAVIVIGCTVENGRIYFTPPKHQQKKTVPDKITTHEFRCLIIEDVKARSKLPKTQLAMLTGKNLRDFFAANCVKDGQGNPEFRIVDKRDELTGVWKEMAAGHNNVHLDVRDAIPAPIIVLRNGDAYEARPLPTDWAELQMILEQYAGVTP